MTKSGLAVAAISATYLMLLGAGPVYAGNNAALAEAYFKAIAGGNADGIASFYAEDAEFHWIGGPLAGVYKGKDKIRGVWDKFGKAAGRINYDVVQLTESAQDKNTTVTAWVKFTGEGEVPVKFTLIYKDGKIVSEIWQVHKVPVIVMTADTKPAGKPEPELDGKPEPNAALKPEGEAETKAVEPKVAEAKVAEPKAAEAKAAEPKAAEPKAAEPKAAEPKAAEPKAAEPKAAEPKAAEAKAPEPKAAEPKVAQPKVEARDSNPVPPPPAAKKAASPAQTEPRQAVATDRPAEEPSYKPQNTGAAQANAVEVVPVPVPAGRGRKAVKTAPDTAVASARLKARDAKKARASVWAEEESRAGPSRYYGYSSPASRYYGYGSNSYSYAPYGYRRNDYEAYDEEPVHRPYRGYSYYGYNRGYYGYGGGYGRY